MFKRKDWVLLRRGQGAQGDAMSTSSSSESVESEDASSSSESLQSSIDSVEKQEAPRDVVLEDGGFDSFSEEGLDGDDNDVATQVREWYEAGKAHRMVRGKALQCTSCTGKRKLLLNSVALVQHVDSRVHQKRCGAVEKIEDIDGHLEYFIFADESGKNKLEQVDVETHSERLQRIQSLVDKKELKKDKSLKGKKRKSRPGKRQRLQKKGQESNGG